MSTNDGTTTNPPSLEAARKLVMAERFAAALELLTPIIDSQPEDQDALYMAAVCERYLGHHDAALRLLERLKTLAPDHARAHQEEGHVHRDRGDAESARRAYTRAVQLNPALEASYRGLIDALLRQGRNAEAKQTKLQLEQVLGLPRPLIGVTDLIGQGKLLKAEELCRAFLKLQPTHIEGMRLLADIGIRLGVLQDAEFLLESAVALDPQHIPARIDYVRALRKRQKYALALDQAHQLLSQQPDNPQFQSICAIEHMQTGDYDRAIELFDDVLTRVPGDAATLTSKGHALKTRGDADAAVTAYRSALASLPQHGEAYYALANLKTYRFTADELAAMHALESDSNLTLMDRVHLEFALGKASEDEDDHAAAFQHYAAGNRLKKQQSRYNAEHMHDEFQAQQRICTRELFEARAGSGDPAPDPIFIVGLPRAGSTLLEQILASHSQVDGTLELPNILALSQQLRRRERADAPAGYPDILPELSGEELAAFGKAFIEDTRIHRQDAPFFIDKMPNNFRHIGLIKLILPNAKIIDARRHPMACCFSGFKQLFAEGQEFSYDLEDIGHYYRDYVELMDHWDAVLPDQVLRVLHEDVVDDLEQQVRRILDFCGLPFEDACLRYWETDRNVRTPSSEQVRKPIFRESVEQWRHYDAWLGPLKAALGPALDRYPIEP